MKLISFRRFKSICKYCDIHFNWCYRDDHPDTIYYGPDDAANDFGKCCSKKCPEWGKMKDGKSKTWRPGYGYM